VILGIDKLMKLIKDKKLVEHLSERELENPTGAGFDLRIGELYEVFGSGFLHIEERKTPELKLVAGDKVHLKPGKAYVMKTMERVNAPDNLVGLIFPRSTLYRSGILLSGGVVDPGYNGELSFGLFNLGAKDFELEIGARVAHILFFEVKGKTKLYHGQWQGGRMSAEKGERQV